MRENHRAAPTRPGLARRAGLASLVPAAVMLTGIALTGCNRRASPEDCRGAAEHYVNLAISEMPGHASLSPTQAAAVREVERGLKRAVPAYRDLEDRCTTLPRSAVTCAQDAESSRAWEACLRPTDGPR